MEFKKFIDKIQNKDYEIIKEILIGEPYRLKVKERDDLCIISLKEDSNLNIPFVRDCNGIIVRKDTMDIVCYSFSKMHDEIEMDENDELTIENVWEGTLVRIFYHGDKWRVATKNCIDAFHSKWANTKSFGDMFYECIPPHFMDRIENMDKNLCFSFILIHPENLRCIYYKEKNIIHIQTIHCQTLEEMNIDMGVYKSEKNALSLSDNRITNMDVLLNILKSTRIRLIEGYIIRNKKGERQKIRTDWYNQMHKIFGNYNNHFHHYLLLRRDKQKLEEYITYFPHFQSTFLYFEGWIVRCVLTLSYYYTQVHVHKQYVEIPKYFRKAVYELHRQFLKDRMETTYEKIMNFYYHGHESTLCYIKKNTDERNITI
jgi:hypothetical protein